MILVDTSIWVDRLRTGEPALAHALDHGLTPVTRLWTADSRLATVARRLRLLVDPADLEIERYSAGVQPEGPQPAAPQDTDHRADRQRRGEGELA